MRLEPHAIGAPRGAPGARQRRDLGHQRQDDDGRDGRRHPRARAARASSTTAPGRTWPAASPPRCMAARATATPGLFEVDEFWLGQVVERAAPARAAAGQPLPRPARPLRRARHDRRPLGGGGRARTPAALVLNADDPLVADLGARRARTPLLLRRRGRRDGAGRRCSTPPTPSTAGAAARPTATTPSTSATSAATTATAAAPRAPTRRSRAATSCSRACAARASRCARRRASAAIALPLPGLYNVYNALGAAALALALGATARPTSSPACSAVSPAFGRAETVRSAGASCRSCSSRTRPAPTRSCARSCSRPASTTCFAVLNDHIADGRDVTWVWDADFEVLAPRVRRATCSGTRAAELALRLKYAGVPTDRIAVEPDLGAGLDARARERRRAGSSRCPPTRRCSALRDAARRAAAPRGGRSREPTTSSGTTSSAAPTTDDLPLWRELADRERLAGARRRRRHRPRDARPRAPRPRGRRARPRPRAAGRAARARRRPARRAPSSADARDFDLGRRFAARHRADADAPAARRPRGPRALPGPRARAPARRAACWRPRWPTRSRPSTTSTTSPRCPT